jgi:hypothetical protein
MLTEAHPRHTSSASQTGLREEPKRREMTYLMEFLIMTAFFMFIMVVIIGTATFLPVRSLMFDEENTMQARVDTWR